MMKKQTIFTCILCVSTLFGTTAYGEEPVESIPTYQTTALLREDTAFIPLREAANALGCTVTWDRETRSAVLSDEMRQMDIREGQDVYTSYPVPEDVVGVPTPQELGTAFIDEAGKLLVPAEVFSILIGYDVAVDGSSVTITPQQ